MKYSLDQNRYCPIAKIYCQGEKCQFWNIRKKWDAEKKEYVDHYGYCLVRDWLLSSISKNAE